METFCCVGKTFYYVGLILYMICDSLFDWSNYVLLYADKEEVEEWKVDNFLFFFSSSVGLIINIFMLWVYGHYINFHCDCIFDVNSKDLYNNKILDWVELWLSVVELVLKDDIQSVIVFLYYASQLHLTGSPPGGIFIAFSVCNIFAHFKRCVCFFTKLCACGEGEECSCIKLILCLAGSLASVVFLFFTILSLPICGYDGKSCLLSYEPNIVSLTLGRFEVNRNFTSHG